MNIGLHIRYSAVLLDHRIGGIGQVKVWYSHLIVIFRFTYISVGTDVMYWCPIYLIFHLSKLVECLFRISVGIKPFFVLMQNSRLSLADIAPDWWWLRCTSCTSPSGLSSNSKVGALGPPSPLGLVQLAWSPGTKRVVFFLAFLLSFCWVFLCFISFA